MKVWHGTSEDFEAFRPGTTFFSTDRDFASDYCGPNGRLIAFEIPEDRLLDTRDPSQLQKLIGTDPIKDPYSGLEYRDAASFLREASSDTWEAVEEFLQSARAMGFDGLIVTEGGVVNVALFDPELAVALDGDTLAPSL